MSITELIGPYGQNIRRLFYLLTPWECSYEKIEDVPKLVEESIPYFLIMIILDVSYCWKKNMKAYELCDTMTSMGAGFMQTMLNKVALRTIELSLYIWVYENWSIYQLPTKSAWTWIIAFVVIDFFYYWMHRASHEINIFWAFHQAHHSSEYYNLSTALRQGVFQQYLAILFYLPQAFFLPPPIHMAHEMLNRLFQFWLHTKALGKLGLLESVINTPSNHRVHHGRNRYCIDKNYAGTLIIWDKMFGTFQEELDDEPVAYGLTHNINTFDAKEVQFAHFRHVLFEKVPKQKGIWNKLRALFYGPGWAPGKSRAGDLNEVPEIENPVVEYHSGTPRWVAIYALIQGAGCLILYQAFQVNLRFMHWMHDIVFAISMILSVYVLSGLIAKKRWSSYAEIMRCFLTYQFLIPKILPSDGTGYILAQIFVVVSAAIWTGAVVATWAKNIKIEFKKNKCKES